MCTQAHKTPRLNPDNKQWTLITHIFSRLAWLTSFSLKRRQITCCRRAVMLTFVQPVFYVRRCSPSLLSLQQHLCLLWYPDRQTKAHFHALTGQAFGRLGPVTLTFSPGRPLSPATPGSVAPGGPCISHNCSQLLISYIRFIFPCLWISLLQEVVYF